MGVLRKKSDAAAELKQQRDDLKMENQKMAEKLMMVQE